MVEGSTRSGDEPRVVLVLWGLVSSWTQAEHVQENLQRDLALGGLARNQALPGLGALTDDVGGVLLVLALAGESELVLGLAVGDLVDTEPLVGGPQETGQVTLDVLDVVELGGKRVVDVDNDDLPVCLLLVEQGHDAEDLDLLDLTRPGDELTNLANVERVVVTLGLSLGVDDIGVLPRLPSRVSAVARWRGRSTAMRGSPGGRHRSSRGSPCGGSSCGQSGACPSWCPA